MNVILVVVKKMINAPRKFRCVFFYYWNKVVFTIKGISFGKQLNVSSSLYVKKGLNSDIIIGDNFTFTSGECFNPLCRNVRGCIVTEPGASIIIGNNVGMSSPCVWAHSNITIGNRVNIGGDCILMDSDAHSINYIDRRKCELDKKNKKDVPIVIGDDVLIGARCIILKGVTIGERSVIGSGSIVTKSIPADCIAGGNPCKIIKYINEK